MKVEITRSNRGYEWKPTQVYRSAIRITLDGNLFAGGIPEPGFK